MRLALLLGFAAALSSWAQLVAPGTPVPHKAKPPVVFLNGYQSDCSATTFANTFATADQVLQANGEVSLFFNNCSVAGKPSIEDLGAAFGTFLSGLKYDDGQPVNTVDAVAHSMGGLILRSYLSGKQNGTATFRPPATVKIRKAVFLATPNFGTPVAAFLGSSGDTQVQELASGSQFLFDLATWNQDTDDLRGVDALAIIGNAGSGALTTAGLDDGVVALTSGSLGFSLPGRTRVVPFCHTGGGGLIDLVCRPGGQGIAEIRAATDPQARILLSFLNGTNDWQSIGVAPEADPFLSKNTGIDLQTRSAMNVVLPMDSASAGSKSLNLPTKNVAYSDLIPSGTSSLKTVSGTVTTTGTINLVPGGYTVVVLKAGPIIGRVYPAASVTFPLSVAPGEFVAIYGDALAGSTAQAASINFPTQLADTQVSVNGSPVALYFVSPAQIDAIVPDDASGLVALKVQNTAGNHTVNVLVEPAVPSIFTQSGTGSGPASALRASNNLVVSGSNPLRAGDFVELFLTGLGATSPRAGLDWAIQQPTVTIGGRPCAVSYAGRAPGYRGLDQINCQVPAGIVSDPAAQIVVFSGQRGSNVATVAMQ